MQALLGGCPPSALLASDSPVAGDQGHMLEAAAPAAHSLLQPAYPLISQQPGHHASLLQLIQDMLDALDWLDTHFTFSKDQVCSLLVKSDGCGGVVACWALPRGRCQLLCGIESLQVEVELRWSGHVQPCPCNPQLLVLVRVPCTQVEALAQHARDRRLAPLHTSCSPQPAAFIFMWSLSGGGAGAARSGPPLVAPGHLNLSRCSGHNQEARAPLLSALCALLASAVQARRDVRRCHQQHVQQDLTRKFSSVRPLPCPLMSDAMPCRPFAMVSSHPAASMRSCPPSLLSLCFCLRGSVYDLLVQTAPPKTSDCLSVLSVLPQLCNVS